MSEVPIEHSIASHKAEKVLPSQSTKTVQSSINSSHETPSARSLSDILDDVTRTHRDIIHTRNEINKLITESPDQAQENDGQEPKMFRFRGKTYRLRKKES